MWALATFVCDFWYLCWCKPEVTFGMHKACMVDQTGSVRLTELAVMLNDGNNFGPGTTYVTSQSAASGACV